jgi:thioesterase domain-containing protein
VEALRRTIDALVKQNERLEERVTSHQRELASLREATQQRNSAQTGNGTPCILRYFCVVPQLCKRGKVVVSLRLQH